MNFDIEWHDRIGSTNVFLREKLQSGQDIATGLVVAAREQTDGRGRQERRWLSAPDTNLCFSVFIETGAPLVEIPSLTMAVALAVTDALNAAGLRATPKWPNDVLIHNKKICGILSERVDTSSSPAAKINRAGIIVGIGLNVNMTADEAALIDRPATSILIERGQAGDPAQVLADLLPHMEYWIEQWQSAGFAAIRECWITQAGPIGKTLSVHDGDIRKTGTLSGFGEHGELLLETEAGLETIWSGDVT